MSGKTYLSIAWKLLFILGILHVASGIILGFGQLFGVPTISTQGQQFSNIVWTEFQRMFPRFAFWIIMVTGVILGAFQLSFGVLMSAISYTAYRRKEKWSWYALLVTNLLIFIVALVFEATIEFGITSAFFLATLLMLGIFLLGILLPVKEILRTPS